jgi:nucleoside-diphosphate-sugar epimerase
MGKAVPSTEPTKQMSTGMRRLIAGCGYLGFRVAQLWRAGGDEIHVLTRSAWRARHFQRQGLIPWVGDVTRPATLPRLPEVDTLLWSVGFDRDISQTIDDVYVDGLHGFLDALPNRVTRLIYISSTGVYGQADGRWVNEATECRPQRYGGRVFLAAEQLLLRSPFADRAVILRLAGVYGPQRLPRLKQLRAGEPLDTAPQNLLNLIHVDDAAQVVQHAADRELPLPRVFLVADGQPVVRAAFYAEAARLFGTSPAVFCGSDCAGSAGRRTGGHKRVCSDRMRAELGISLRYPSYREGLAAIVRETE